MKSKLIIQSAVFSFALLFALSAAMPALAAIDPWAGTEEEVQGEIGFEDAKDPRVIAGSVINIMLGFLGIIAVVIILLGGFKWMTATGNDDKIGEAKKLMIAGVIGLIIVLASWGLATFVLKNLIEATGGAGT